MKLFTTQHRRLGVLYLLLSLAAVGVGTLLSLVMRIHRVWPDTPLPFLGLLKPEDYLALVTMHGTLMIFFVLTVAPQIGFASLVLPEQIGARSMAFPRLNAIAFWIAAAALIVLLAAFFVPKGAPISGWTAYPPLSAIPAAGPGEGAGMEHIELGGIAVETARLGSLAMVISSLTLSKIVGSTIVLLGFGVLAFLWGKSHKQKSS